MESGQERRPWYRRFRYIVLLGMIVILLIFSFVPYVYRAPVSPDQVRLNRTVVYFAHTYNFTTGLIAEYPGSHTYWLYSDNYLATLALARYDPGNSSTTGFASSVYTAMHGYLSTAPEDILQNQYEALNSTAGSFACSAPYAISWAQSGKLAGSGTSTSIMTTANNQGPACSSQNYADLLLLQALHYHRLGNSTGALYFYNRASTDFNGVGFVDLASNATLYQTYKLALYVYASSCLGQTSGASYGSAVTVLFSMQDNSTGGFFTGYTGPTHPNGSVNTETTALAALALETIIHSSAAC